MWTISLASSPKKRLELDDPTLHFRHDALSSPDAIRLMELVPGAWESDVQCSIHTVNLNALPEYDALSYTWGEDPQDDPGQPKDLVSSLIKAMDHTADFVRCNGKIFPIGENLYNALRRLRDKSARYLWVDRICIDQSNLLERSDQVQKMGRIYSGARLVAIWLGEEDNNTVPAFTLIEKVSKLATESVLRSLHTNSSLIFDSDAMRALGLPSFPSTEWESMHRLFERRWFQRSWVVQEVALANAAIAICGCRILNWDDIGRTGQYLVANGFFRAMQHFYGRQGRPTFASSIQNCRAGVKLDVDRSLTSLLCSMRRFKATDLRDSVYSLLGLAKTNKNQATKGKVDRDTIYPDYSSSIDAVFHQITKILIEQDSSLALLSTVEDASLRKTPNLPSWVPDYAVWQESTILGMPDNLHQYYAGGDKSVLIYSSHVSWDDGVLSLAGYEVDTIIEVGNFLDTNLIENSVPKVLRSWLKLTKSLPETYVNGESQDEATWRTLIGNFGGSAHPAHIDYARHFLAFLHHYLIDDEDLREVTGITNAVLSTPAWKRSIKTGNPNLYATSFIYIAGLRRFFVTKNGYIGLGPKSVQTGDNVFVFPGGIVPFVLRSSKTSIYRFVGEAYVHGIMNGEVLKDASRTLAQVNIR